MTNQAGAEMTARILAARRKRLIGSSPVFERYVAVSNAGLDGLERRLGQGLPESLRAFLLVAGYSDIHQELSFREEWFSVIDRGQLAGHVMFAQDDSGNFYAFGPADECIYFVCRSSPVYALMAESFSAFFVELERRGFGLQAWTESLEVEPYDWKR